MGNLLKSFKKKYPATYYILIEIFPIAFSIGLTIYLLISNSLKYYKYVHRDTYELDSYNGSWYMYKINQTTAAECPPSAAFNSNSTTEVYKLIVNNRDTSATNTFTIFFWVSTGLAVLLSIVDNGIKIHRLRNPKPTIETSTNKCTAFFYFVYKQLLKKYTFVASSYFISIFDFSKLCLERRSRVSMFNLDYISIIFTSVVIGGPLILIDMCMNICDRPEFSYKCICSKIRGSAKNKLLWCCCCLFCGSSLLAIPCLVFGFGAYIFIVSLVEKMSRVQSILIGTDMILAFNE